MWSVQQQQRRRPKTASKRTDLPMDSTETTVVISKEASERTGERTDGRQRTCKRSLCSVRRWACEGMSRAARSVASNTSCLVADPPTRPAGSARGQVQERAPAQPYSHTMQLRLPSAGSRQRGGLRDEVGGDVAAVVVAVVRQGMAQKGRQQGQSKRQRQRQRQRLEEKGAQEKPSHS